MLKTGLKAKWKRCKSNSYKVSVRLLMLINPLFITTYVSQKNKILLIVLPVDNFGDKRLVLDVDVLDHQSILLDKFSTRLYQVTHQGRKDFI